MLQLAQTVDRYGIFVFSYSFCQFAAPQIIQLLRPLMQLLNLFVNDIVPLQASAQMAGMKVVPVGTAHDGSVNMDDLIKKVRTNLTRPEKKIPMMISSRKKPSRQVASHRRQYVIKGSKWVS